MSSRPGLTLSEIAVTRDRRPVLLPLSAHCTAGALTGILGPNGAGKSTLLKALAGTLPTTGQIFLDGQDLHRMDPQERARQIGYLPQDHSLHWPIPVRDVVALGRLPHRTPWRSASQDDQGRISAALRATDVDRLADRPATALSGGERARVHLARVLAGNPRLILADEPVAALDPAHQIAVMDLLRQQARQAGRCVVIVLHDLTLAARYCDHLLLLADGRLIAAGTPAQILRPPVLTPVYGIEFATGTVAGTPVILSLPPAPPFGEQPGDRACQEQSRLPNVLP